MGMKRAPQPAGFVFGIVFATTVALSTLLVLAFLKPEAEAGHVKLHADFPTMLQGGSGVVRHGDLLWLGWGVGILEILLFVGLLAVGARRGGRLHGLGLPLLIGTVAYLGIWTWLMLAYRSSLGETAPNFFLALPAPTAIMLYVLWPVPVVFVGCFVFGFRRWVLTREDQAAFEQLVARRRAREQEDAQETSRETR